MKYLMWLWAVIGALFILTPDLRAQTLVLGAGYSDFSDSNASDEATIALEYQHAAFRVRERFEAGVAAAAVVDAGGDVYIGVGLVGIYSFKNRWFAEVSIMPGYYNANDEEHDLGGDFQFRSLGAIGYEFENGNRLSMALTHKSNASTNDDNPGVNALLLRFHKPF